MSRSFRPLAVAVLAFAPGLARAADDADVKAILDRAIKAAGGEEKLRRVKAATWSTKGKLSFGDNDSDYTGRVTVQGLDRIRQEIDTEFGGNKVTLLTVLAGDKGWRKFGDMATPLDADGVAAQKRAVYLQVVPVLLVPLTGKDFKVAAGGETKVDDKPAVALQVTGPDGREFTLAFDKETGLPAKLTARVSGFMGGEFTQETTFGNYKDFGGIKRATKTLSLRDGKKFLDQEVTEFKVLDQVPPGTFDEPK